MSCRWAQLSQGVALQVSPSHSAPGRFVPTLGLWLSQDLTRPRLHSLHPLLFTPALSCFPPASEQLALHTWFPFLSCLWHLGSAQGSSCCACLLVPLPKLQLLIPALSPTPTSSIFAHPWMAEYSFPPCLIAVNTNSSSFFRLLCRF